MRIFKKQRRRKKRHSQCGDCDAFACDCGNCDPFLLGPTLLALIAAGAPSRAPRGRPTAPGRAGVAAIRGYQRWLSPRLGIRCRHEPSCSEYGVTAVHRYGLATGVRLTAGRIRRCTHTVPRGTVDPVP